MKVKNYIFNLIFLGGWFYINYQIYLALSTGAFTTMGRSSTLVTYSHSPIEFVIYLVLAVIVSFIFLAAIVYSTYSVINRKIGQYGGSYNLNTLKAILRGWKK